MAVGGALCGGRLPDRRRLAETRPTTGRGAKAEGLSLTERAGCLGGWTRNVRPPAFSINGGLGAARFGWRRLPRVLRFHG